MKKKILFYIINFRENTKRSINNRFRFHTKMFCSRFTSMFVRFRCSLLKNSFISIRKSILPFEYRYRFDLSAVLPFDTARLSALELSLDGCASAVLSCRYGTAKIDSWPRKPFASESMGPKIWPTWAALVSRHCQRACHANTKQV